MLELTKSFAGDPDLEVLQVLLLQEVIAEPGVQFLEDHGWTLVSGKNSRDWRGTAIAYRSSIAKHTNSTLLPAGIASTLTTYERKHTTRYIAGHIPHHATIAQTEAILGGWLPSLAGPRVILGVDANEAFTDPDQQGWRARTGRGELILATLDSHSLHAAPQDLHIPTYHPYNTAMESRRLDYVFSKGRGEGEGKVKPGSRHMASSDHDLVVLDLPNHAGPRHKTARPTWGGRRYAKGVDPKKEAALPPTQTDTHTAISMLARRITEHGRPSQRFRESRELRELRQRARQVGEGEARGLWKRVSRQRKQEYRQWYSQLVTEASQTQLGGISNHPADQGQGGVAAHAHRRPDVEGEAGHTFPGNLCEGTSRTNPAPLAGHPGGARPIVQAHTLEPLYNRGHAAGDSHMEEQPGDGARLHHPRAAAAADPGADMGGETSAHGQ